jgi:hypothetical protein
MRDLPLAARAYVTLVIVGGIAVVVFGALHLPTELWAVVVPLMALFILADRLESPLPGGEGGVGRISVTMPVAIAAVLLTGPGGAPLVAACTAVTTQRTQWYRQLFNSSMIAIASFAAAVVYEAANGVLLGSPGVNVDVDVRTVLWPCLLAILTYELTNGLLLVVVIALTDRVSPVRVWYGQLAGSAFPLFIYSIFGLLLAVVWSYIGMLSALLVLAPLAVARWVFAEFALRQEAYEATMRSLIKSVETKDLYTRGHSERVSRASVLIGRRAGMREDRVASLRYAGMLHDVGKLGVPTSVLQKAGRLTDDEYEAIQQHTVRGREIVKDLEFLGEAIEGILLHHERIDGRGYPMGKVGSEIPEFARIIAVADAFDSMTTTRSYRGARSIEDAFAELVTCKGSQFDPVMVDALIAAIEAEGWDASDTLPVDLPAPGEGVPTMASDDDDPTVATHLGIPSAAPHDASELDGDSLGETVGGDRP